MLCEKEDLLGGLLLSYQRKENSDGTRDENSEGSVGVRHAAEPSSA